MITEKMEQLSYGDARVHLRTARNVVRAQATSPEHACPFVFMINVVVTENAQMV